VRRILVTGGAGYIGSVVVDQLLERGFQVVVLDDLSAGHRQAVARGRASSRGVWGTASWSGRSSSVSASRGSSTCCLRPGPESVAQPQKYVTNNVTAAVYC